MGIAANELVKMVVFHNSNFELLFNFSGCPPNIKCAVLEDVKSRFGDDCVLVSRAALLLASGIFLLCALL